MTEPGEQIIKKFLDTYPCVIWYMVVCHMECNRIELARILPICVWHVHGHVLGDITSLCVGDTPSCAFKKNRL